MPTIVGIRFKDSGKTYYFDPHHLKLKQGDFVIVDTTRGPEMARVVYGCSEVPENEVVGELKTVLRRAESSDFERMHMLQMRHDEVLARCEEKVKEHNLPMNLVKAEYSFDGSRLTFYFVSEQRVDFRMLVRDLARTFRSRIELRQIGPRDEAKLLGGIGPCGRLLCCATFLPDYARVSIKMAKDQDLPLNPSKISGVCGRLLCCLSYEHQQYVDMKAELPSRGDWVQTPDGPGDVVSVNVLKAAATVRLSHSGMEEEYTTAQIQRASEEVATIARSRTREGITPASDYEQEDDVVANELLKLLDDDSEDLENYSRQNAAPADRKKAKSRTKPDKARPSRQKAAPAPTAPDSEEAAAQPEQADKPSRSSRRRRRRKPKKKTDATGEPTQAAASDASAAPPAEQKAPADDKPAAAEGEKRNSSTASPRSKRRRRKRKPKSSSSSSSSSGEGNE